MTTTLSYDLLESPLLTWRDAARRRRVATLPGVLAHLGSGELGDFPRLRTHQLHPWCMLLTQLAAIALHRAGQSDPRLDEDTWRKLLLALTDGEHEPWCLVVEELHNAAFLQPPVPEGTVDGWKACESPDDIDVLVTAKAHDVKTSLIPGADAEAWVYALVTLQTMQGYPGRGYTGIARMKKGYGNRPRVGLAPDQSLSARFLRDVGVLLDAWPALTARGFHGDGLALVWTVAWDGVSSLAMNELSPHFIEVCWRVRCVSHAGRVLCRYTTTKRRRCIPERDDGDVGDPWGPVERDAGLLTIGRRGFHYDLLRRLLFGNDFEPAAAQALRVGDSDPVLFVASALARGQGKTEGLHERVLTLDGTVRRRLWDREARESLGRRAEERVASTERMQRRVLYPALKQLDVAGSEFDGRVDEVFFEHLFATLDDEDEEARLAWERELCELATSELQRAVSRCAFPSARRFKIISDAERMLAVYLRKHFPDIHAAPQTAAGASV